MRPTDLRVIRRVTKQLGAARVVIRGDRQMGPVTGRTLVMTGKTGRKKGTQFSTADWLAGSSDKTTNHLCDHPVRLGVRPSQMLRQQQQTVP